MLTDQTLPPLGAPPPETSAATDAGPKAYRVLARKYRPRDFSELVGQEALVRTLTNAIKSGRLAHAFMLTGVRGVGKTTTARIIARALNCTGPDGKGGPTITPCGVCENCKSITADRHVDVMEMDAASHTGVDDIREIIEGVRYGPVAARYKVYVIDEVHMLSKNAFNALLKTLEEPPEHVKFIFATTEIRKVPVTVLSRCQRFDLRRIDSQTLVKHFNRVAEAEGVTVDPDAMALIARAADGSARDGLSLLDQAMALGGDRLDALQVRDMLGLADRARVVDLFEAAMTGQPRDALDILSDLHRSGADPVVVLQDLLDFTHFLTRFKVVPETALDPGTPETERVRGGELSGKLGMPALTRAWQILLKGLGEVQSAPVPFDAAEMVIVRLAYSADLPNPADLIRQLQGSGAPAGGGTPAGQNGGGGGGSRAMAAGAGGRPFLGGAPDGAGAAADGCRAGLRRCRRRTAARPQDLPRSGDAVRRDARGLPVRPALQQRPLRPHRTRPAGDQAEGQGPDGTVGPRRQAAVGMDRPALDGDRVGRSRRTDAQRAGPQRQDPGSGRGGAASRRARGARHLPRCQVRGA